MSAMPAVDSSSGSTYSAAYTDRYRCRPAVNRPSAMAMGVCTTQLYTTTLAVTVSAWRASGSCANWTQFAAPAQCGVPRPFQRNRLSAIAPSIGTTMNTVNSAMAGARPARSARPLPWPACP